MGDFDRGLREMQESSRKRQGDCQHCLDDFCDLYNCQPAKPAEYTVVAEDYIGGVIPHVLASSTAPKKTLMLETVLQKPTGIPESTFVVMANADQEVYRGTNLSYAIITYNHISK